MQGTHTFSLGTLDALGRVHLSPAGRDLVRAIIMKGLRSAKNGLEKAEAMKASGAGDLVGGSISYYRHAAAYLSHMLTSETKYAIDLRDELKELRGIPDGEDYPTQWTPFLILAANLMVSDVAPLPTGKRNRGVGKRRPGSAVAGRDRGGKGDEQAAN